MHVDRSGKRQLKQRNPGLAAVLYDYCPNPCSAQRSLIQNSYHHSCLPNQTSSLTDSGPNVEFSSLLLKLVRLLGCRLDGHELYGMGLPTVDYAQRAQRATAFASSRTRTVADAHIFRLAGLFPAKIPLFTCCIAKKRLFHNLVHHSTHSWFTQTWVLAWFPTNMYSTFSLEKNIKLVCSGWRPIVHI
jgi:hypothetical protein